MRNLWWCAFMTACGGLQPVSFDDVTSPSEPDQADTDAVDRPDVQDRPDVPDGSDGADDGASGSDPDPWGDTGLGNTGGEDTGWGTTPSQPLGDSDPWGEDDDPSQAYPLSLDQSVLDAVTHDDPDWYVFSLPAGVGAVVILQLEHAAGDIDLYVTDTGPEHLMRSSTSTSDREVVEITASWVSRTFFIEVAPFDEGTPWLNPYELAILATP